MSNFVHTKFGDGMQDNFDDKKFKNTSYFLQRCVKVEEFYDYEFGTEFFVTAPVEVNDMYNQN